MSHITRATSRGQLVTYLFGQDALAANQSDIQLPVPMAEASTAVDGYAMPFAGDVVAIAWSSSTTASAGTATIGATIGGTEDTDTTLTVTTEVEASKQVRRGACPIAKNARLGCELTTDGSWNGTSADLIVAIYVLHYLEGI